VSLKKEQNLVSNISAYVMGSLDEGLLVISGKLNDGVSFEEMDAAFWKELDNAKTIHLSDDELLKIMNKIRTSKEFGDQGTLNRAMNLCSYELLGDANMINHESEMYQKITSDDIHRVANIVLQKTNCSLLKVKAIHND
jgi:zinc protease